MAARALVLLVSFDARSSAAAGEAVFWDLDKGIQGLRLPDIEEELLLAGTAAFMPEELAAELVQNESDTSRCKTMSGSKLKALCHCLPFSHALMIAL